MTARGHHLGRTPQSKPGAKSLLRNLGEFCGHIAKSVKTPVDVRPTPTAEAPRVVREQVQEHEVQTAEGKIVLRRRIIDEVEPAPKPER